MSFFGGIWDKATDFLHHITGIPTAADRRNSARLLNEQIRAYKQQTDLSRKMLNDKRNEEQVQKRRIEEKQIRSLRRNYGAGQGGMLGQGNTNLTDITNKLGG